MRGFAIAWVAHICNGKRFWVNGKQVHFGRCILAGAFGRCILAGAFQPFGKRFWENGNQVH
jgi:hypothetical protein